MKQNVCLTILTVLLAFNANAQSFEESLQNAFKLNKISENSTQRDLDMLKISLINSLNNAASNVDFGNKASLDEVKILTDSFNKLYELSIKDKDFTYFADTIKGVTESKYGTLMRQYKSNNLKLSDEEKQAFVDYLNKVIPHEKDKFPKYEEGSFQSYIIDNTASLLVDRKVEGKELQKIKYYLDTILTQHVIKE